MLEQLNAAREAKQLQMQQLSTGAPSEAGTTLRCCKCNLPPAAGNELRVCCAAECSRAYHPRCLRSPPAPGSDSTWLCPRCAPRQSAAERRAKFLKWSGAAPAPSEPSPPTLQVPEGEETPAAAAVAAAMAAASNKWAAAKPAAAKAKSVKGRRPLPPPATEAAEEEEEEADEREQEEEEEEEEGQGQDLCPMTASDAVFDVLPPSVRRDASAARGKKRARPESTLHVGMRVDARWSSLKTWYPGTCVRVHADGDAAIQYCDGDHEERVSRKHIRPTKHGEAPFLQQGLPLQPPPPPQQPLSKSKARPRDESGTASDDPPKTQRLSAQESLLPDGWELVKKGSAGHYYNRYVGPGQLRAQSIREAWKVHEMDCRLSTDGDDGNGDGGDGSGDDGGGSELEEQQSCSMRERQAEPPPLILSKDVAAEMQAAGLDTSPSHEPPFDQVKLPAAGTLVEVRMLDDGLLGSRYPASVIDWEVRYPGEGGGGEARALVEYQGLYASDKAEGIKVRRHPRRLALEAPPPSSAYPPRLRSCSPCRALAAGASCRVGRGVRQGVGA